MVLWVVSKLGLGAGWEVAMGITSAVRAHVPFNTLCPFMASQTFFHFVLWLFPHIVFERFLIQAVLRENKVRHNVSMDNIHLGSMNMAVNKKHEVVLFVH